VFLIIKQPVVNPGYTVPVSNNKTTGSEPRVYSPCF
jgi:hypothetical protein